ncbi:Fpg/Nei family DNA glycosylase [Streptomyces sp. AJS327]|uniref:Fpg/Nei family DNA glycosylase n=1 Tax=Streptomyces sp. AJS327 TaxID=2545265 RepID=UPI0015DEFE50|nr:Fpg/Nei family DNA glycosylase [Streptomyces sp. AJS327]MBA0052247.1 Fpg/Nei family DNA glycosylase [Streptomyces sp. AJS327]
MPELPEVEALRSFLADRLVGHPVARVLPLAVNVLKTYDPPLDALDGRTVTSVARHGKFLDLACDGPRLVLHLARAGWVRWHDRLPDTPPRPGRGPLALRLELAEPPRTGFDLTEAGPRKDLAVYCVWRPDEVPGIARLGPDPLDPGFTPEVLAGLLRGQRHRVKGLLRDQSVLAGVGNAYSDEILHAARLSPYRLAAELTEEETGRLYVAIGAVLREAVAAAGGVAAGRLRGHKRARMRVHGRAGEECPVCGDTVRSVVFRDSSLEYCPACQTDGRILADRRMSRLLK